MKSFSKRVSILMALLMILSVMVSSFAFAENAEKVFSTAKPTNSTVLVNGSRVEFESYNINNNNYFKLRDLAKVLSGTEKQFQVIWNDEVKSIELISNKPYTEVGGELAAGDGIEKRGVLNTSKIFKDGAEIELVAYTINGNNFFKLRDVGQAFDIGINWDGQTQTVGIDTSMGYVVESEESAKPVEPEVKIESITVLDQNLIRIKFNQPIPASKVGEQYFSIVFHDYIDTVPWEIGEHLNLVEGQSEYDIIFNMPAPGNYELFMGEFGEMAFEV